MPSVLSTDLCRLLSIWAGTPTRSPSATTDSLAIKTAVSLSLPRITEKAESNIWSVYQTMSFCAGSVSIFYLRVLPEYVIMEYVAVPIRRWSRRRSTSRSVKSSYHLRKKIKSYFTGAALNVEKGIWSP
jgi:hypothetical protein